MSKWLITLTDNSWTEYNIMNAQKTFSAFNQIVEFKGDLPTEKEIRALTNCEPKRYVILTMQKLQEEET